MTVIRACHPMAVAVDTAVLFVAAVVAAAGVIVLTEAGSLALLWVLQAFSAAAGLIRPE
jgi:hypothetical protein